ncbi:MAG: rhodanese-like domain-containing protein [Candidatus Moranbacteria bacterium]|nr:rhodanese-like domain-containing protein [Candidatus Moranbacteria bacterium]
MTKEKDQSKVFFIGFLLIVAVIAAYFLKPAVLRWKDKVFGGESKGQSDNAEILKAPSVMADDVFQMIQDKKKVFLIDISPADDFDQGHIATAVNVSADGLNRKFFEELGAEKTSNIFLINQGDNLAILAKATNAVVAEGFVNTQYLRGGIADWMENGYPLVSSGKAETDDAKVKKMSLADAQNEADSLQFVDVRSASKFQASHIAGAINIPLSDLESEKEKIPSVQKVVVYGADAVDSFQAAVKLFDLNFFNIYQLDGTFADWKTAGGKTE